MSTPHIEGNLEISPVSEHLDLLAPSTAALIKEKDLEEFIGVAPIDPNLSDTAAFCEQYKVGLDQSANCVILKAKKEGKSWYVACMVLATNRLDVNGVVRRHVDTKKISFAPMEEAVSETKMEFGAITPIGLPEDWPILIDSRIIDLDTIIIGSGIRKSKLVIPGNLLGKLPNAVVLENMGTEKTA